MTKHDHGGYARCYESHPPLLIKGFPVLGGSCISPVSSDADVYVGLDGGMPRTHRAYPWEHGVEFLYRITDMAAPENPASFKRLIAWLVPEIEAGKKVHIGCIGGHGRTGMVLAALVREMTGEADAIAYVRQHYCKKAVETQEQVKFLHDHFGVQRADPYKTGYHRGGSTGSTGAGKGSGYHSGNNVTSIDDWLTPALPGRREPAHAPSRVRRLFAPIPNSKLAIW